MAIRLCKVLLDPVAGRQTRGYMALKVAFSKLWALPDETDKMYPYPEDVNQDGTVNIFDAVIVRGAWWTRPKEPDEPADPTWQMVADIGGPAGTPDDYVNIIDIVRLRIKFGKSITLPLGYGTEADQWTS